MSNLNKVPKEVTDSINNLASLCKKHNCNILAVITLDRKEDESSISLALLGNPQSIGEAIYNAAESDEQTGMFMEAVFEGVDSVMKLDEMKNAIGNN